ncbi:tetratricopeptide repeat protein [candidate division WOR-3 bacterium]|nr:tetratricopeptide repeat protein [candidate division WOR-3 bacterium]
MPKGSEIAALRNEANKAKIQGDTNKAIEYLERIYDFEPGDANNLKELGSLYNKLGKKKKAVEFYWKALENYREAEYYQNATAIAQMLLRFGEDELLVKHELAFLYEKQGLLGDAVASYEELAELYKKEGDIEGVLENLKKIVNITPKKLGIRLKLAEIYENQSKFNDLVSELEEIKGIFKEQGRVEEVEAIERRIASLASKVDKSVEPDVVRETEVKEKKVKEAEVPEEMIVEFEQEGINLLEAVEEEVSEAETQEIGEPLFESLERASESLESTSTEGLFDMEEEVMEGEEPQEVEFVEKATTTADKKDIEVAVTGWEDWMNLAELYESVGSIEESLEYYNKAADANFNKKNYEAAYKLFSKMAELDTLNIISRQKMIQSALKLNSKEKAVESYFSLYECLKEKKADSEAEKILDKIENIDPGSVILEEVRGKKKKRKKEEVPAGENLDFEGLFEAEVSEQMTLQEEPELKAPTLDTLLEEFKNKAKEELDITDYAAHFNLGITYKEMDLIEEAIDEFKKAMKEKSWRLKSLEMLGVCHELLNEIERAEDIYKLVINNKSFREDQKAAFYYHLGNLYARQGTYGDALDQYKKIVKIDQEFADVKTKIRILSKKMAGEEVEEEISLHFGDALSEESSDLWDSVLTGGEKGQEPGGKTTAKRQKGKISYI